MISEKQFLFCLYLDFPRSFVLSAYEQFLFSFFYQKIAFLLNESVMVIHVKNEGNVKFEGEIQIQVGRFIHFF